ncbi:MAG: hypothetical protein VKP62_13750, partial [Candidatus Sericytochromatia bacterium]|nr:hypothetical protein [Candidatus Sericytochromatia bacterium]
MTEPTSASGPHLPSARSPFPQPPSVSQWQAAPADWRLPPSRTPDWQRALQTPTSWNQPAPAASPPTAAATSPVPTTVSPPLVGQSSAPVASPPLREAGMDPATTAPARPAARQASADQPSDFDPLSEFERFVGAGQGFDPLAAFEKGMADQTDMFQDYVENLEREIAGSAPEPATTQTAATYVPNWVLVDDPDADEGEPAVPYTVTEWDPDLEEGDTLQDDWDVPDDAGADPHAYHPLLDAGRMAARRPHDTDEGDEDETEADAAQVPPVRLVEPEVMPPPPPLFPSSRREHPYWKAGDLDESDLDFSRDEYLGTDEDDEWWGEDDAEAPPPTQPRPQSPHASGPRGQRTTGRPTARAPIGGRAERPARVEAAPEPLDDETSRAVPAGVTSLREQLPGPRRLLAISARSALLGVLLFGVYSLAQPRGANLHLPRNPLSAPSFELGTLLDSLPFFGDSRETIAAQKANASAVEQAIRSYVKDRQKLPPTPNAIEAQLSRMDLDPRNPYDTTEPAVIVFGKRPKNRPGAVMVEFVGSDYVIRLAARSGHPLREGNGDYTLRGELASLAPQMAGARKTGADVSPSAGTTVPDDSGGTPPGKSAPASASPLPGASAESTERRGSWLPKFELAEFLDSLPFFGESSKIIAAHKVNAAAVEQALRSYVQERQKLPPTPNAIELHLFRLDLDPR